jgi:transposase
VASGILLRLESREETMVAVAGHLSLEGLEQGYRTARDGTTARHFEVIRLMAKGHSTADVSELAGFGIRWIEELVVRYNSLGPGSLGDLRRHNGKPASLLTAPVLAALRLRLDQPPDDGGVWTSKKAAAFIAAFHGLSSCSAQRGWEALKAIGWSIQVPRPKNPQGATEEERQAFKKTQRYP